MGCFRGYLLDLCSCCPSDFSCVSTNDTILCYKVYDMSGKIRNIKDNCASDGYDLLRLDSEEKETILDSSTGEFHYFYKRRLHALLDIYICEIDKTGFYRFMVNFTVFRGQCFNSCFRQFKEF